MDEDKNQSKYFSETSEEKLKFSEYLVNLLFKYSNSSNSMAKEIAVEDLEDTLNDHIERKPESLGKERTKLYKEINAELNNLPQHDKKAREQKAKHLTRKHIRQRYRFCIKVMNESGYLPVKVVEDGIM